MVEAWAVSKGAQSNRYSAPFTFAAHCGHVTPRYSFNQMSDSDASIQVVKRAMR